MLSHPGTRPSHLRLVGCSPTDHPLLLPSDSAVRTLPQSTDVAAEMMTGISGMAETETDTETGTTQMRGIPAVMIQTGSMTEQLHMATGRLAAAGEMGTTTLTGNAPEMLPMPRTAIGEEVEARTEAMTEAHMVTRITISLMTEDGSNPASISATQVHLLGTACVDWCAESVMSLSELLA